jgi:hypothetical protein
MLCICSNNVRFILEKFIVVDFSFALVFLHRVDVGIVADISEVKSIYSMNHGASYLV